MDENHLIPSIPEEVDQIPIPLIQKKIICLQRAEALTISVLGTSRLAIIVQTNFQICAYTTSELHVSMLGLFCDETQYRRLPNVCFFKITRDSVKSAFQFGIGAGQVIICNVNT